MNRQLNQNQPADPPYFTQTLFSICGIVLGIFISISFLLNEFTYIYSALMGSFFSFLGFRQLIRSQAFMLRSGKKYVVFISFVFRLILYAVPFILALRYKGYFNLGIILVFLFIFQFGFVISELIKNLKGYKKRMQDG